MDILIAIFMGIALSAACGFRVFVPLFVAAIGVRTGDIQVIESFAWIGSDASLVLLGVATVVEILGYYVPWVDNALDTIATPAAVIAGTLVTASFITEMSPMFRWSVALIAGGGIAGTVQVATVGVRALSTATTGGLANPLVSTTETATSTLLAILAVVVPILALTLLAVIVFFIGRRILRSRRQAALMQPQPVAASVDGVPVQVTAIRVEPRIAAS